MGSLIFCYGRMGSIIWANLEKLENETFMKIIMNQEPIEAFDTFVEEWYAQGGDKITEEVAEYYNEKK